MATLFVRHEVSSFDRWKKAYDEFNNERTLLGVTDHGVYQEENNPNDVTVYHHFDSMDAAHTFASTPRLMEVMKDAGVVGASKMWFANRV